MSEQDTKIEKAAQLWERAQHAVNRGDLVGMLDALTASGYLDGLTRRLQQKWGSSLPSPEVDDCIAQAVDAACAAVSEGRSIRKLGAWLWKAATNTANDKWRSDYAHSSWRSGVLVEAAHPDLADALTVLDVLLHPVCQEELYDPGRDVSINPN